MEPSPPDSRETFLESDIRRVAAIVGRMTSADAGLLEKAEWIGLLPAGRRPEDLLARTAHLPARPLRLRGTARKNPPACRGLAEGTYVIVKGDPRDAAGTYPLEALMALFANEKATLLEARHKRLEHERESRRWRELHPPAKTAEAASYWLRPHRGSRYLTETHGEAKKGGSAR